MVFANLVFLYIFLPLNLILYYAFRNAVYRNCVLILFSFIFYAWGDPLCLLLLLTITIIDFILGIIIEKYRGKTAGKFLIVVAVIINLTILVYFKYSGFLYENLSKLFQFQFELPDYIFPLGISFYIFRSISYLVDIYRDDSKSERSFINFLMFMSLYHLVSGPIVRHSGIPSELKNRKTTIQDISHGITRFCIGLFKKVCIANVAGVMVSQYMPADPLYMTIGASWFGLLMFAIQIYFDFSGYTDMAIGLGRMFGFHYTENFNYPYISRSATDFWRRWHISLSTFLRDYIFTPLALKMRHWGKTGTVMATLITFAICGFWHGPTWNYIIWGLYFGVLMSLEILFLNKMFKQIPRFFSNIYALIAVIMGWLLFYFTDLEALRAYVNVMFGNTDNPFTDFEFLLLLRENIFWIVVAFTLCLPVYPLVLKIFTSLTKNTKAIFQSVMIMCALLVMNTGILFLSTSLLLESSYNPFLYLKF